MTTDTKIPRWVKSKLPRSTTGGVVLGLGAAAWLYLLIATGGDLIAGTVWSVPFLLAMAAVTTPWRSLPFRNLAGLFLVGFGPIFLIALGVQWILGLDPIDDAVSSLFEGFASAGFDLQLTKLSSDVWAPLTEEILKVVPVLLLLRWRATSFTTLAGPLDYAVVGGATGAGFAFAEDTLVLISPNFLTHPSAETFGFGVGRFYQNIVGADSFGRNARSGYSDVMSFFFPEMQELSGATWAGHGALAFGLGLAIGLAVWLVRRNRNRIWYLLPVVMYLWVTWEHVLANWYGGAGCNRRDLPLCTLADIDLRGRILPVVILAGFGVAAYLSGRAVRELKANDRLMAMGTSDIKTDGYASAGWRGWLDLIRDGFEFLRLRHSTAYGANALMSMPQSKLDQIAVLAVRTRALILRQVLTGDTTEPIPEAAAETMRRVAPFH